MVTMPKILYASDDNGELYLPEHVDITDPATEQTPDGFVKYEIEDKFTLRADQVTGGYGVIVELLLRAKVMKRV